MKKKIIFIQKSSDFLVIFSFRMRYTLKINTSKLYRLSFHYNHSRIFKFFLNSIIYISNLSKVSRKLQLHLNQYLKIVKNVTINLNINNGSNGINKYKVDV